LSSGFPEGENDFGFRKKKVSGVPGNLVRKGACTGKRGGFSSDRSGASLKKSEILTARSAVSQRGGREMRRSANKSLKGGCLGTRGGNALVRAYCACFLGQAASEKRAKEGRGGRRFVPTFVDRDDHEEGKKKIRWGRET